MCTNYLVVCLLHRLFNDGSNVQRNVETRLVARTLKTETNSVEFSERKLMELRELHYIQLRLVQSYTVFCIMASERQFQAMISLNMCAMNLNFVQMKGKTVPVHAMKVYR